MFYMGSRIITKPMCMRQIKRRIDNRTYRDVKAGKDDVHLMFDNARIYNQEGSWVWNDANILQEVFDAKFDEIIGGSGLPGDLTSGSGSAQAAQSQTQGDESMRTDDAQPDESVATSSTKKGGIKVKLARRPTSRPADEDEEDTADTQQQLEEGERAQDDDEEEKEEED